MSGAHKTVNRHGIFAVPVLAHFTKLEFDEDIL